MSRRANVVRHGANHLPGGSDPSPGLAGAVVATTVAGLGPVWDGKLGLLRMGASPYSYIGLIYDETYGKWISPTFSGASIGAARLTTTSTSYVTAQAQRAWIGSHDLHYDAGLRLQVSFAGFLGNSGAGNTTTMRVAIQEYDGTDTALTALWTSSATVATTGTTAQYQTTGAWGDVSAGAPTKGEAVMLLQFKVDAGAGFVSDTVSRFRWVSS